MEGNTQKFIKIFRDMYDSEKISFSPDLSFSDVMKDNNSRLEFLIRLLNMNENNIISSECRTLIEENIDFLKSFISGEYNKEIPVPTKYYKDMSDCSIVPRDNELDYLFNLIEANINVFDLLYKDRDIVLKLPDNSFNMNMERVLEVKEKNLAHLIGLTDSQEKDNPNSNLLLKYFLDNVEDHEQYGDTVATQFLHWIISKDGRSEIKKINQITLDFIKKDKKRNPNSYDKDGNIKNIARFKKDFKEATSLDYPIIKFSRYIAKAINNLNYLQLYNINQVILDYNAPIDPNTKKKVENDEKDIFIINTPLKKLISNTKNYTNAYEKIDNLIQLYIDNYGNNTSSLEAYLSSEGINVDDKDIEMYINLKMAYVFVGKHGIEPDQSNAENKISAAIGNSFNRDVHIIGFGTDFDLDEDENIKITDLDESVTNYAHCDTSISVTAADLINKYYKRGRAFFIDKIEDTNGHIIRLSNPIEEIDCYNLFMRVGYDKRHELEMLIDNFSYFARKYHKFKNMMKNNDIAPDNNPDKDYDDTPGKKR